MSLIRSPGFGQWWHQVKRSLSPDLVTEIDRLSAASDAPIPIHELIPWFVPEDEDRGSL